MSSNELELTFEVAVPVERAWSAFTEDSELRQWAAPDYEIDAQPGGKLRWSIPPWEPVEGEVLEVEPNQRLVYSEGDGMLDGTTRVTVTFESAATGTRVTIVHAGFGDGASWQHQLESHRQGWLWSFRDLVLYLETGLPSHRFLTRWRCDFGWCLAESFTGLEVIAVDPNGWAEEAGLEVGDHLLYLDGQPIFERTDTWPFQIRRQAGSRVTVDVARDGRIVTGEGALRAIGLASARVNLAVRRSSGVVVSASHSASLARIDDEGATLCVEEEDAASGAEGRRGTAPFGRRAAGAQRA